METSKKNTKKVSGTAIFRYVICILLCLLAIFPFYVLIINSTLESNVIKQGLHWLPGKHFFTNYQNLMIKTDATSMVSLWGAMKNSLIITVPTTVLQVYFASLTAYGLTVYNFKGRNLAWAFIYAIMMIPTQVSIVGLIKVCQLTGMYGTFLPLILPAMAAPTTVYFMKQYMQTGLSVEIVEAARIDGAGKLRQIWSIAIPCIIPTIITLFIMRMGQMMSVGYEKIILLYNELIYNQSDTISTYVYRIGFQGQQWSYTTAIGLFNSFANLILLAVANAVSKKVTDSSLW